MWDIVFGPCALNKVEWQSLEIEHAKLPVALLTTSKPHSLLNFSISQTRAKLGHEIVSETTRSQEQ